MITRDVDAFLRFAHELPADRAACAKAVYLVAPDGFSLAADSASDNHYMDMTRTVDGPQALAQHRALHRALSAQLPSLCFAGDPVTPDAVFPNNAFGTAPGRLLIGHMRHPLRQRETARSDIRDFFTGVLGYRLIDLSQQPGVCELTGSMVIDRARGLGYCGLSERCDAAGAAAMHAAFDLRTTLMFDLAAGEYHTNVVMSVLAGRALVACPAGFGDSSLPSKLAALYPDAMIELDDAEKAAFAGNCIAITPSSVWMSELAGRTLRQSTRDALQSAGFAVETVELDEIEKAGGSLRCCVGELF